jgi:hypothetical protein
MCSEADPTEDLFTLMISTSANRATFILSAASFLKTYGLDGIGTVSLIALSLMYFIIDRPADIDFGM